LGKKYEAKDLKASVQSPPDLTLYVQAGSVNLLGSIVTFAGGNSSSFTVPTTNPRIDLLCLTSTGALEITEGTENASPSAPSYPFDKFVICEVYNRLSQSVIKESSDGVNGYIYKDVRGFVAMGTEVYEKIVVSDELQHSNDNMKETDSTVYIKLKEIIVNPLRLKARGVFRIKFDLRHTAAAGTTGYVAYGRIYKNGEPIGTEQSNNLTGEAAWQTKSEDLTLTLEKGDLLQIYGKMNFADYKAQVENFRLYYTNDKLQIIKISSLELETHLPTIIDSSISYTNQDPA